MNKKFSTLMASLLLASAFSSASAVTTVQPDKLKEGDFVRLQIAGSNLEIAVAAGQANTLQKNTTAPTLGSSETDAKNYINAVNAQLWKVAKITKTSTGAKTFQFVNKLTGEYLAVDLATDWNDYTTKKAAKLSATGNREWAIDANGLYAYSESKDSTFRFTSDLKLFSNGSEHSASAALTLDQTETEVNLTVNAFNALMKMATNNGKLNFNGGKDVSSTQTNILKNTNWEAKGEGTTLYLTNGKTTEGSKLVGSTWGKVDKKMYLQVDTNYYDAKTPNYFKLAVDTINYELDLEEEAKPVTTHPNELAQFAATFEFLKDSIGISAKYVPEKSAIGSTGNWELEESDALEALITVASTNEPFYTKIDEHKTAIDGLATAFQTWLETTIQDAGVAAESKFSDDAAGAAAIAKVNGLGDDVKAYADLLGAVKVTTAYSAGTATPATLNDPLNAASKKATADAYVESNYSGDESKTNAYNALVQKYQNWVNDPAAVAGLTFVSYAASEYAALTSANISDTEVTDYTDALKATSVATSYAAPVPTSAATDVNEDAVAEAQELAEKSAAYTYKNKFDALIEAYNTWAGTTGADLREETFEEAMANNEAYAAFEAIVGDVPNAEEMLSKMDESAFVFEPESVVLKDYFWTKGDNSFGLSAAGSYPVSLRSLADVTVLTVNADDEDGYVLPLIQPYATTGGDATDIVGGAKVYNLQVQDETSLRATANLNKYVISVPNAVTGTKGYAADVDASNVYAQWVFIPGTSGYYSIVNRATKQVLYTGPVSKVKDAADKVVADTYVMGTDTLKVAGVTLNEDNFYTEKVGDKNVKYDYSGTYYAGTGEGTAVYKSFAINPVSPFLSQLAAQFDKDSVMVLGSAEDAPVWYMEKGTSKTYGVEIDGLPQLKKQLYRIYTRNADDKKIYVYADTENNANVYAVSLLGSKHVHLNGAGTAVEGAANFEFRNIAEGQYQFISSEVGEGQKMTINATPSKPILEVSKLTAERNDLFMINKSEVEKYRKLTAEDGVLGNAKIYMENEPNRYLYENTANIVANNGTGLNFLGIYNTAELTKNAALYVDTAFVERKDVYMPQYMFALGVEEVEAQDAVACTYEHNHYDNAGNKVDAAHCSHATPATMGYKAGRYLVALNDSTPENGSKKTPVYYDNAVRLAFVNAIHRAEEDSLIIKDSKWTDNNKQLVAGKETTYASKDTIKIADNKLIAATFALLIKDQETKSFYLQTANAGDKAQFVRILNGVPVLTKEIEDAAVFNIEATTEEATANEAIAAEGVQVIAGKGAVTVQGAAGKVITVANVLGQTIANQVAASDNVTIAAPAGIVVVAVEGEATKVVVK